MKYKNQTKAQLIKELKALHHQVVGLQQSETKVRRLFEALQESEESYRGLYDQATDAIYIQDREGRFLDVNQGAVNMYGYPKEFFIGKTPEPLAAPGKNDMKQIAKYIERAFEGEPQQFEFWGKRKNGEVFPKIVRLNKSQYFGKEAIIAFAGDITDRKREEEVKASIYRISEAVHSAQNLELLFCLIHDIVGELMSATNFYIALYDPISAMLSFPYFVDEYDDTPAPKKLSKGLTEYVLSTGNPLLASPEVYQELVKKGEVDRIGTPSIDWLGVPLKTEDNTIGVLVVQSYTEGIRYGEEEKNILVFVSNEVAMAIEHKRVEVKLIAAQEYTKNLINSSLDMIISVDEKRRIVEFNQAAEKTFGYSKAEVMGKYINILYANPAEGLKAHRTTRSTGRFYGEILNRRKNGETFISYLSSSILRDENGEFLGVMGVSRDITERVKTRKELEKALEQAEQGTRIKTLFLANMSHEIRTPLNAILGFTDLIEESISHLIGQEERTYFETIQHSGKRLLGTVHKILDISQIEAGGFDHSPKLLDLMELIQKVVKEFKPAADDKGLELSHQSKVENANIRADEYCITSALSNLIDNAIKYTEKGKVKVILKGKGNKLSLTIKDTGIGISEEYKEHLFDTFSQESIGYTKEFQGIGLGLALTKQYLDMSDVGVDVHSTKGQGTTFVLTFTSVKRRRPVEKKLIEKLQVEPSGEPSEKPIVLVVEDDIASQKLTSFFLKRQYDTCFSVSVTAAKEQLKKQKVDLILLDLSLGSDEDGLELARYLRKTKKWREMPIVAVTAHAFKTDQDRCLAAGCNDYLPKPIKQKELLEKIKLYI